MLRRTMSSDNKVLNDQENEFSFDSASQKLPTPSPNRSKYEGKFGKRRPLGEKTNKNSEKAKERDESEEKKKKSENGEEFKEKKSEESTSNTANINFQDLFHLNETHQKPDSDSISISSSSSSNNKIEELSMALSETLQENEQLNDTVSLLKAEIDRLNGELLEYKEYSELYLLGKELIENQCEEIENLKQKLVKRGD